LLPLTAVLLVLAACGSDQQGDDVASVGNKGPSASASAGSDVPADARQRALAYAKCMRDNGMEMPDPPADGGGVGAMPAVQGDPNDPKVAKALEACQKYAGGSTGADPNDPEAAKRRLAFAKCMREHGVDIPDDPMKGMTLDMSDPKAKQAMEACQASLTGK
jgi:hypothetical protein